jgi:hypothetical protein
MWNGSPSWWPRASMRGAVLVEWRTVMRKTIHALGGTLTAAAFCAVLTVPHAVFAAEPGLSAITITGAVPPITYLPDPTQLGNGDNASFSGHAVTIAELADSSAHVKAASITLKFDDVSTNYPARIGLSSKYNGLKSGEKIITYQATAVSTGISLDCTFPAAASQCLSDIGQAKTFDREDITLEISTSADTSPTSEVLPAGIYSDTLTLKVGATL